MQLGPVTLMATVPPGAGGAGRFIGLWCGRGWLAESGAADWPLVVLGEGGVEVLESRTLQSRYQILICPSRYGWCRRGLYSLALQGQKYLFLKHD